MFDFSYITTNTENPTLLTILFTIMFAFLMSVMIAFVYEKTSRQVARPDNYIQALILIGLVAATIMQAIGDSLARGLGMLGALSIIRFRTTLRNPRNIVFMFSSLASGIACGVGGYLVAAIGTLGLCLTAVLLRFTPFSKPHNLVGTLVLESPNDDETKNKIQAILKKHTIRYSLGNYRVIGKDDKPAVLECRYQLKLKKDLDGCDLANELNAIETLKNIRLRFRDTEDII